MLQQRYGQTYHKKFSFNFIEIYFETSFQQLLEDIRKLLGMQNMKTDLNKAITDFVGIIESQKDLGMVFGSTIIPFALNIG